MPEFQPNIVCLENLIGLAQANCPCHADNRPIAYNTSISGLFMDDYEHGVADVFAKSAQGCGDGSIWDVLQKARYEGINDGVTYLFKAIGKNKNTYVDGFSGSFGEVSNRAPNVGDTGIKKDLAGITIRPNVYNGASILFKRIWLALDKAGTYDVLIHDMNDLTTPVATISIVHPGGDKKIGVDVSSGDMIQPLSDNGQRINYVLSYVRNGAVPLNYTYYCGCGNQYKPPWMKSEYMVSRGFSVDNLSDIEFGNSNSNREYTSGLIVDWELICDPAKWMCTQDESFWTQTAWGRIAAKMFQLVISQKVIAAVLDSGRVNFYTLFSAEALQDKRIAFQKLTDDLIIHLSEEMPEHVDHCWQCKSDHGFSKRSIIT